MPDQELHGRVAVITGAGRSIGRAMALELAAGGAAVVVNVRSNRAEAEAVVKEIEGKGGKAMVAIADVIDAPAVNAMAEGRAEEIRPHRLSHQQRGAARGEGHRAHDLRGLAPHHRRHPRRRVPLREGVPRSDQEERRRLDHQRRRPDRRDGRARPPPRRHRQGRHRRLHPRAGDGARSAQDHRQHAGPRHAGEARQAERNPAASDLPAAARPRRLAGRHRAAGALPGRPGRALHHRPDSSTSTAGRISAKRRRLRSDD